MLWALLPSCACAFNAQLYTTQGRQVTDVSLLPRFKIGVFDPSGYFVLDAVNHRYSTDLPFIENACQWRLMHRGKAAGSFDRCLNQFEYAVGDHAGRAAYSNGQFLVTKTRRSTGPAPTEYKRTSTNAGSQIAAGTNQYELKAFICNDSKRFERLGKNVDKENKEIAALVDAIFSKSNAVIGISMVGSLNLLRPLLPSQNLLRQFKELVEPVKYSARNLTTPLSQSDLVILLTEEPPGPGGQQGMSYFEGSKGLGYAYAVVHCGPDDSKYFIAKKVAHEIAHTLGARHDIRAGYLMEPSACSDCSNDQRVFSPRSLSQVEQFLKKHRRLFQTRSSGDEDALGMIDSVVKARRYINSRRKHSFSEIVAQRLNGRTPEISNFTYYLAISFLVYLSSIFLAIFYLK
ncbi:hypothetical protein PAPHI01_0743 [Pancytospora philotis]|nr:hypothetical protein PAPHI01_0743 [Pancytospora philotis]